MEAKQIWSQIVKFVSTYAPSLPILLSEWEALHYFSIFKFSMAEILDCRLGVDIVFPVKVIIAVKCFFAWKVSVFGPSIRQILHITVHNKTIPTSMPYRVFGSSSSAPIVHLCAWK